MTQAPNDIRSLIVAGSGALAWLSAVALSRAFSFRNLDVLVVDTGESRDSCVGRWTLPSQRGMHGLLGVAEPQFLEATGATFKLATEHVGWQGNGSGFLHAHGEIGADMFGAPFYKYLQGETLAGRPARPEYFSIAGIAAQLGKFARPTGDRKALTSSFTYGFHIADAAYARFLRSLALDIGVRAAAAPLAAVVRGEQGDLKELRLADGAVVGADLYVDCTGPEARLLSEIATGQHEDWSSWLPCDRMLTAFAPPVRNPPPMTQTLATSSGWSWRAPLATATMVGHVYSTRFADDAAARATLQGLAPTLQGEPMLARFEAGRRCKFWERNCVALGSAAVQIEPLAGADMHLAQLGIAHLIELFPLALANGIESAEYNRLMAEHADALRDFTIAHYRAGPARSGEFWTAVRSAAMPARLADKLDLYEASGRINLLDHDIFEELDWAWLLMGCGSKPAALELQIRTLIARVSKRQADSLRAHVEQLANSMPSHIDFVRHQATLAARAAN